MNECVLYIAFYIEDEAVWPDFGVESSPKISQK